MKNIYYNISTLGKIGYLPASGTCTTFISFIFFYFFKLYLGFNFTYFTILFIFSFWILSRIEFKSEYSDPKEVVIDELLGTSFLFIYLNIQNNLQILSAFLLFRFFDITKTLGIKYIEKIPGPLGILLDDIAASAISIALIYIAKFLL